MKNLKFSIFGFSLILFASTYFGLIFGLQESTLTSDILQTNTRSTSEESNENIRISKGLHYSAFSNKAFFEEAFNQIADLQINANENIKAIVVNHHLLAKAMIAQIFEHIKSENEKTVVLLSPNHFLKGEAKILMSEFDFKTPYGNLEADFESIEKLKANPLVEVDERVWQEEHGITNMVSFIKRSIPNAKLVPIIVKENLTKVEILEFVRDLNEILPENAVFIGSFDFSHTLPKIASDFHDQLSMEVLRTLDYTSSERVDVDSQSGINILLRFLELRKAKEFSIVNHASAADILQDTEIVDNTSYITGFWKEGEINKSLNTVTLLTFGDMMLDRYVRLKLEKEQDNKYPFQYIERFLYGQDITYANLEGPLTDFKPRKLDPNNLIFTFNPEMAESLKELNFNLFGLANNHTFNFGDEGLNQTEEYLAKSQLDYFGNPKNEDKISFIKNIRGVKLAFIGYSELHTNNFENIVREVERIKLNENVDYILVFPHWGIEYRLDFSKSQQEKARKLIDAGADLIIGTHPHVIQPLEIYNGKMIFYSLGNFLFDQTFSKATQTGLGVGMVLKKDEMQFYLLPHETDNFQIKLLSGDEKNKILNSLNELSEVSDEIKEMIRNGKIEGIGIYQF